MQKWFYISYKISINKSNFDKTLWKVPKLKVRLLSINIFVEHSMHGIKNEITFEIIDERNINDFTESLYLDVCLNSKNEWLLSNLLRLSNPLVIYSGIYYSNC